MMSVNESKLLKQFEGARDDLGIQIVAPCEVHVADNVKIRAEILVKDFGGKSGTLVFTNYDVVEPYQEKLAKLGYGFSVLAEPKNQANEIYDREFFIEMLSEWGWTGSIANRPDWIQDVAENDE